MIARWNRVLVLVHLLLAVGAVGGAVVSLVMFARVDRSYDTDGLEGFLVLYAAAFLVFAGVVSVLGLLALRARSVDRAAAYSLPLGVVVLVIAFIPATFMLGYEWWWQLAGVVALALPLALIVTSSLGLRQPPPVTTAPRS